MSEKVEHTLLLPCVTYLEEPLVVESHASISTARSLTCASGTLSSVLIEGIEDDVWVAPQTPRCYRGVVSCYQ
jgi:hypothetical protein